MFSFSKSHFFNTLLKVLFSITMWLSITLLLGSDYLFSTCESCRVQSSSCSNTPTKAKISLSLPLNKVKLFMFSFSKSHFFKHIAESFVKHNNVVFFKLSLHCCALECTSLHYCCLPQLYFLNMHCTYCSLPCVHINALKVIQQEALCPSWLR